MVNGVCWTDGVKQTRTKAADVSSVSCHLKSCVVMVSGCGSAGLATVELKVATEMKETFTSVGTYVYREPLCVLQVAEYFVGRKSDAFIHGVTTCAAVESNTFRHGRHCFDAACVPYVRTCPPSTNQHPRCGLRRGCLCPVNNLSVTQ